METIFAHSSGRPPAAIAVIRISGPRAFAVERVTGPLPPSRHAALRKLRSADGALLDEALVLRFDAPASATGEDVVELHVHGGRAVVAAVLAELGRISGWREAEPGEFTRRAFANGRIDLTEAEGLADLLEAETEAQRRAALAVSGGAVRRQVEEWRARLVELSAQAEAAIDYVDEEETGADAAALAESARAVAAEMQAWLERPSGDLLRQGVRVVLAGQPNAGKSSLLNALVGEDKAIVTALPGTTRDRIEVPLAIGGLPLLLVDTAGLRDSGDEVERIGVGLARQELEAADILLWLGDPDEAPPHRRCVQLHAQADRREPPPRGSLPVSALTGEGLDVLRGELLRISSELLPPEDLVSLNRRQATHLAEAAAALAGASSDLVLSAESLRAARSAMDKITGRSGVEDVLDVLFGRFCLGK